MKMTALIIPLAAVVLTGCMSSNELASDESSGNPDQSLLIATPEAPAVDQGLDSHNGTGLMDHDENPSPSPAGGDPQIGGH